jgi:hypothetical protein
MPNTLVDAFIRLCCHKTRNAHDMNILMRDKQLLLQRFSEKDLNHEVMRFRNGVEKVQCFLNSGLPCRPPSC